MPRINGTISTSSRHTNGVFLESESKLLSICSYLKGIRTFWIGFEFLHACRATAADAAEAPTSPPEEAQVATFKLLVNIL